MRNLETRPPNQTGSVVKIEKSEARRGVCVRLRRGKSERQPIRGKNFENLKREFESRGQSVSQIENFRTLLIDTKLK